MSSEERKMRHRYAFGELLLWTAAASIVLVAHAGAVALILQQPVEMAADDGPPAAIMIELAAEAEAIQTDENQIVPDQVNAEEIKTAAIEQPEDPVIDPPDPEPQPLPEPEPEVVPEPKPVEPPPEDIVEAPDPVEQLVLKQLENVEVPLPVSRPPPEKPKPVVKKKKAPAASQAAKQAKVKAKQSDRVAARQTSNSSSQASISPARWQSRLMSHLERRKRYPSASRSNREQGTVYVRFRIDDSGNVLSVALSKSSGHPSLDQAVVEMVRRASPVPAPPPGVNKTIVAPVRFNLR